MRIGVAQIKPVKGDLNKNIVLHEAIIQTAIDQQLKGIFFSELSISGYEPELADQLKMDIADPALSIFQALSDQGNITIGVGVPLKHQEAVQIAMLLFQPHQKRQAYAKQILHEDEYPYFTQGKQQILIAIDGLTIAPAICYESLQPRHLTSAIQMGADIYLASVAKPQAGIDKAFAYFPKAALHNNIPILMSNCTGFCDNFVSVGQSAVWNNKGERMNQLSREEQGILVYDTAEMNSSKIPLPSLNTL